MHDPTERGLAGGLNELAVASGIALVIDRAKVSWFTPGVAVCHAVGADPWAALASGSLLAAFRPADAERAVRILIDGGEAATRIGTAFEGEGVRDTEGVVIVAPARDETARILAG